MSGEKAASVMGVYSWVAAWNLNRPPLFGAGPAWGGNGGGN